MEFPLWRAHWHGKTGTKTGGKRYFLHVGNSLAMHLAKGAHVPLLPTELCQLPLAPSTSSLCWELICAKAPLGISIRASYIAGVGAGCGQVLP